MNKFRVSLKGGGADPAESLLPIKQPRAGGPGDNLAAVSVARSEARSANHRDDGRHRLPCERATIRYDQALHQVELVNLSGGGAMIAGALEPMLWDRVDLILGDPGEIESAVRWIRGGRIGLEFAHETRIDCSPETREDLLREVIRRSFPELEVELARPPAPDPQVPTGFDNRRAPFVRHPLIWSGLIHFDHDSRIARLRNVSKLGAMVETTRPYPDKARLLLDLGDAGTIFATVGWSRGDQVGLAFAEPFDLAALARLKPELAPRRWAEPEFLRDERGASSPWAAGWGRMTIEQVQSSLARENQGRVR